MRGIVCSVYRDVQRMVTDGRWKLIHYYRSPVTSTSGTNPVVRSANRSLGNP
ncbi:hypothetical protein [Paenibacillus sp. FSL H7-0331]|uniref:hypothetical protein n=1 Tax=Paenibacillus sp. FSL H7-0331 TaxID=1920421 RepID=UPI0015C3BA32|nr:hypothetical protein [Paenibacillus sp. FSL H7-0331]